MVKIELPLEKSYINHPEKNPFRKIYDSEEFRNPQGYPLREFPLIIDIEATNHCNFRCTFCARNIMKRSKGYMSFELYQDLINEMTEYKAAVKFSRWGEPFLHPRIYEMFEYAKKNGLLVHVTTNGVLFDPKRLEHLDSINFSFQGTTKEEYCLVRNTKKYDLMVSKIEELVSLKQRPAIGITTTVLDEDQEMIKDFIEKWVNKVEQVSWGYTYYGHLEENKENRKFKERQIWAGRSKPCTDIMTRMSVDWDGYLTACCADYDRKMAIGHFPETSLKKAWLSKKMQVYRELILSGNKDKIELCRECANRW